MTDRADPFTAVLDANVLAGALTRNILLSLAEVGLFRPRLSRQILDEVERYIAMRINSDLARRQRQYIETAFPEAIVTGFEPILASVDLPDADDRHVVACAIQTRAAVIVTNNLKDFPSESLSLHKLEAISLDDFIADILDLAGVEAVAALRTMRQRFNKPELDATNLINKIEKLGLIQAANFLTEFRELL